MSDTRETLARRARGAFIEQMISRFRRAECQHPSAGSSCGAIIDAHSLSRIASLSHLADETGHVLSFHPMKPKDEDPQARPVGLKVASTFRGMCQPHDQEFAPIDAEPFKGSALQCMLLAFRAISFEIYRKAAHVQSIAGAAELVLRNRKLSALANHEVLENGMLGSQLGLSDMAKLKADADEALLNRDPARMEYRVLTFAGDPVLAATGVLTPDFDLDGNRLQDLGDTSSPCEVMALSLLPSQEATHLVFAWSAGSRRPKRFVESLLNRPPERIPRIVPQICLGYLENVYFSRPWWHRQSAMRQRRLGKFARFFSEVPLPLVAHEFVEWRLSGVASPAD